MRPPRAAAALAVGLLLVLSGCLGFGGPDRPPSDERAEEALEDARAAATDVSSYRTSIDGRVEAQSDDERLTIRLEGQALTNVSVQRMNASVRAHGDSGSGSFRDPGPRRSYIGGYTAYVECPRIGWERQNLSDARPWLAYTPVGQQLALLNRTDVYWRGTETIDGTETNVIQAYPTEAELQAGPDARTGEPTDLDEGNVENATVTLWTDTDTDRPVKAQREIRLSNGGATATVRVTFRFSGYNEPIQVTRPVFGGDRVIRELGC